MKKKILALLMVACMAVGMLAACGGNGDDTENKGSENKGTENVGGSEVGSEEDEAPELSKEVETLKMIMITVIGSTEEADQVEAKINEYIEPLIYANVEIEWLDLGEYFSTIIPRLIQGETIDILPTFGTFVPALTGQEALMPLDDLIKDYGKGIAESVGADYMKAGQINGTQYVIPTVAAFAQNDALLYRTDIVEELNLDLSNVKTLADLTPIFAAVKAAHPEMTMICANSATDPMLREWDWDGLGDEYGVLMNPTESTTVVNLFETEEYKEYITLMNEWYKAGYIQTDAAICTDSLSTIFETGLYFGTIAKDYPGNVEEKFGMSAYSFASIPLGDAISTTNLVTNNVMTIPENAEYPEKAMAFINLLYTDATLQNLFNYGIEGQHYQLVDGRADYMPGEFIMNAKYVSKYHIGNYTLGYEAASEPAGIYEEIKEFNKTSATSAALGFSYDSTEVADEITAIANVCAKYRRGLEAGSMDPSELDNFISELKAAGIDTVIAAKQAQLDAWLAAQN